MNTDRPAERAVPRVRADIGADSYRVDLLKSGVAIRTEPDDHR
jgi:hypothetical protein